MLPGELQRLRHFPGIEVGLGQAAGETCHIHGITVVITSRFCWREGKEGKRLSVR